MADGYRTPGPSGDLLGQRGGFSALTAEPHAQAVPRETGVGAPERPVQRRDKNLRPWYVTLVRCGFYVLDAIHLRWLVKKMLSSEADVVVFDRYFYDQLAVLPIEQKAVRIYARLLFKLVPRPDIAYLLDADQKPPSSGSPNIRWSF